MPYLQNGSIYLKRGSKEPAVKYVQELLNITVDGAFGKMTEAAVKEFQKKRKLTTDGVVGAVTFTALMKGNFEIRYDRTRKILVIKKPIAKYGVERIFECKAISGLPAAHPRLLQLIDEGRADLKKGINYMHPKYDDVSDAGPIPDGKYKLTLKPKMPYDKTGGGWGVGGWFLDPGIGSKIGYKFGWNRGEFFLHHDGKGVGTSGCIGVSSANKVRTLRKILTEYQKNNHSTINVFVR